MNRTDRLAFHRADSHTGALLRNHKALVLELMPMALDRFYDHVAAFPDAMGFFRSPAHLRHARDKQIEHWETVLDGRFDDAYVASVTKIGETHHRIGLEPSVYIAGYGFLLNELQESIASRLSDGNGQSLQQALSRVILLDMDYAIAVYIDAGKRERDTAMAEVAKFSDETAENVQTVAAASEELVAAISEISRQVSDAARLAETAKVGTRTTTERIEGLSESATVIGGVVRLISTIASQTNLLALNATIEAARAGDQGRGFAVVATEVKQLAKETAEATKTISRQILDIQKSTAESVSAIGDIAQVIEALNAVAGSIATAVDQQSGATREISKNIQQVATGTLEVTRNLSSFATR